MIRFCVALAGLDALYAHSWADIVGGGSFRGAQGINDLVKERYFCPLKTLAECQPPAKTGVVLDSSNMRPCRTDFDTPTWGSAVIGESMYVHWAGNGHTGEKGEGTCVTMYLTPYSLDPDFSNFRKITACLPFSYGADITDANVTIPSDLKPGDYTLFWLWDFSPFWYSSCSDIRLIDRAMMTPVAPTGGMARKAYEAEGCSGLDTGFCSREFGSSSYCKTWALDRCGRSECKNGDIASMPCSGSIDTRTTASPSSAGSTQMPNNHSGTTPSPSATSQGTLSVLYRTRGCASLAPYACSVLFGPESYCKTWNRDGCGRSTCFGTRVSTQLGNCA
jgi:hypothetical protein